MQLSFRRLLPVAQATVVIVSLGPLTLTLHQFASTVRTEPARSEIDLQRADARRFDRFYRVDTFATYWSVETNLPATPVIAPLLIGDRAPFFRTAWRVLGFGLVGIGLWFFIGRFVDDVLAAGRGHVSPRRRVSDIVFFAYIVLSSLLILADSEVLSFVLHFDGSALRASSVCWLVVGCTCLLIETRWERRRRQRRVVRTPP
jgi:hypothetical protein